MKVNAGSGACAYFVQAGAQSPDLVAVTPGNCWHVSMENGGFSKCRTMTCTPTDDGEIDPPADFKLPANQQIPGRNEAETLLREHVRPPLPSPSLPPYLPPSLPPSIHLFLSP